jgi:hypothetical protein
MQTIDKAKVKSLIGHQIYAVKKDGSIHSGKLLRIKGNRLILESDAGKAHTKAVIPLVLFDLLAIGTSPFGFGFPFGFGGFGGGFGGFGGFGGPFFW